MKLFGEAENGGHSVSARRPIPILVLLKAIVKFQRGVTEREANYGKRWVRSVMKVIVHFL